MSDQKKDTKRDLTPAEFTRLHGEDEDAAGPGAGPGAPETVEPVQGRPGPGGHGPDDGPGGPAMAGMAHDEPTGKSGEDDASADPAGAAGTAARSGVVGAGRAVKRLKGDDPDEP